VSRRRLWALVGLACLALVGSGLAVSFPAELAAAGRAVTAGSASLADAAAAQVRGHWRALVPALVLKTLLGAIALWLYRRRGGMGARVRRLAQRGLPVPAIARRTGLAQDAVRDLLGGDVAAAAATDSFDQLLQGSATARA
jgi:hypothetical protein